MWALAMMMCIKACQCFQDSGLPMVSYTVGMAVLTLQLTYPTLPLLAPHIRDAFLIPGLLMFSIYGYDRVCRIDPVADILNSPRRVRFHRAYGKFFGKVCPICLMIAIVMSFRYKFVPTAVIFFLVLTVLYTVPLLPGATTGRRYRLKEAWLAKNAVIGVCFTLASVGMPLCVAHEVSGLALPSRRSAIAIAAFVFLFVFAGSLVSDINDIKGDAKEGTKTLAIKVGTSAAARLSWAATAAALGCVFPAFAKNRRFGAWVILVSVCAAVCAPFVRNAVRGKLKDSVSDFAYDNQFSLALILMKLLAL